MFVRGKVPTRDLPSPGLAVTETSSSTQTAGLVLGSFRRQCHSQEGRKNGDDDGKCFVALLNSISDLRCDSGSATVGYHHDRAQKQQNKASHAVQRWCSFEESFTTPPQTVCSDESPTFTSPDVEGGLFSKPLPAVVTTIESSECIFRENSKSGRIPVADLFRVREETSNDRAQHDSLASNCLSFQMLRPAASKTNVPTTLGVMNEWEYHFKMITHAEGTNVPAAAAETRVVQSKQVSWLETFYARVSSEFSPSYRS